jgi:two-component system, NtrC family, nitrogen regulation sensor histidine kinase GlnL
MSPRARSSQRSAANPPERRTASAEDRLATIFDNLETAIVAVDVEGRVTRMNQAAEQLVGRSLAGSAGRSHRALFRNNPWLSQLLDSVAAGKPGHIRAQGEIAEPWGPTRQVMASASALLDSLGNCDGAVLGLHDLTLQRDLEIDQQRAQSLQQFGVLVAGLAHEIKNPLSGIRGAVQLLDADLDPSTRGHEYVALVLREVDRLTRLLEQLLDLGTRRSVEMAAVNVHRLIDHVLDVTRATIDREHVAVARLFDPSLPEVSGQPDALTQVFLNLVQNALQALAVLPDGNVRELRITTRMETDLLVSGGTSARRRSRFLRVDFEDTGLGIPPDAQAHLFSPFFTTKPKGTGLGLAISHRIVTDHQGTIRFESEPGRTLFRVILPASEESSTRP